MSSTPLSYRVSPLARKVACAKGVCLSSAVGSGPRGKIMVHDVEDVLTQAEDALQAKHTPIAPIPAKTNPCEPDLHVNDAVRMGDYAVHEFAADMAFLANVSAPIAVQCERLLGGRYTLFDYAVRTAVRACASDPAWMRGRDNINVLILFSSGDTLYLDNAIKKSIFQIAKARLAHSRGEINSCPTYAPDIIICDAGVCVQGSDLIDRHKPKAIISLVGASPKANIIAGTPISSHELAVRCFISTRCSNDVQATAISNELKTLLENPVMLFFD